LDKIYHGLTENIPRIPFEIKEDRQTALFIVIYHFSMARIRLGGISSLGANFPRRVVEYV
jgi:hypothetical protein